jgi:DMSO/TMAO reductase YedYZ molybdopterin-dependent catalytic subunit
MSTRGPRTPKPDDAEDPRFLPLEIRAPTPDSRCVEASLPSLTDAVTPTNRFFIRSHFAVPHLSREEWRLTVEGEVERTTSLQFEDLAALPQRELVTTMECAGNSRSSVRPKPEGVLWGHGAISTGRWRGVPLKSVLELAGVKGSAREVLLRGADSGREPGVPAPIPYEMSLALEKALHPDTLLVSEMNGEPLSPSHGFPVRAIVPGYYGMASVKWLTHVVLLDRPFDGYFRTRAYAYIREGQRTNEPKTPATIARVKSLINWPREGQILATGPHVVRGIAWSGAAPIVRVDVSISPPTGAGEVWQPALLHPASSRYAWRHWELLCDLPEPGFYVIRARATDELGHSQPVQAEWNFRGIGNNSIHCVPVEVQAGGPPDSDP